MKKHAAIFAVLFGLASAAPAGAGEVPSAARPAKVLALGFDLMDTSLDGELLGAREDEARRLRLISDFLERSLHDAPEFVVLGADGLRGEIGEARPIHKCNGCEVALARKAGADYAVFGVVQKVSNLILSLVIVFRDARDGDIALLAAADIRGNNDKSWTNGVRWLLENRILPGGSGDEAGGDRRDDPRSRGNEKDDRGGRGGRSGRE